MIKFRNIFFFKKNVYKLLCFVCFKYNVIIMGVGGGGEKEYIPIYNELTLHIVSTEKSC